MEKKELLDEIEHLINVPNFFKSILHKLEELKDICKDDIKAYEEITALIEEKKDSPSFNFQQFKITRKGKQWKPSIEIPQQIVDYLVKSEIEPGLTKMDRGIKFPDLPGKYNISFEKKNSSLITGMIQIDAPPGGKLKVLKEEHSKEELKEFLYYLSSNQFLYEFVMKQFRMKWKPIVDKKDEINAE
jgi:hypothetical protein